MGRSESPSICLLPVGEGTTEAHVVPRLRAIREPRAAVPRWLTDPFQPVRSQAAFELATLLDTDYTGYEALAQRGRGGVYQARDVSSMPRKLCVIKEGRRSGSPEVD
jgi:hypothetical protein